MFKLALLILIISLLISKNTIEGDGNVNHRYLQSGNIQTLQPVNYFGNYPSRDEPINYSGNKGKKKRRNRIPQKPGTKAFGHWDSSENYDYYYDDYESDERGEQTFKLCQSKF
jgi:hypothetical protein